ncbi:hypothetical protein RFI_23191 [Reticulomyxa filosa]|uniref:Helicase C-terminal domain-containing protein n=1 Tax=Reticulomyxa filosa TaxID=46433 RepID=X6MM59_RETFI|nr:hypothetical protein RFI_23191 [Reticulomyxa filosa]|eukprot:ETO14175.1 hypothetical protein RFI_23191 [Reticulomyxa filosa]
MDICSEYLNYRKEKYLRIDGGTSSEDRAKHLKQFSRWNEMKEEKNSSDNVKDIDLTAEGKESITKEKPAMNDTDSSSNTNTNADTNTNANTDTNANTNVNENNGDANENAWIFLLSTRACSLGLNLYAADTVILFDSDWNPQVDLQAQARVHRIGQKREVRTFRFISENTVEEVMYQRAQQKLDLERKAIECGKFDFSLSAEERKSILQTVMSQRLELDLHNVKEVDKHQVSILSGCNLWLDFTFFFPIQKLNRLIARSSDEVEAFDKMDQEFEKQWININPTVKLPPWLQEINEATLPKNILPAKRRRVQKQAVIEFSDDESSFDTELQNSNGDDIVDVDKENIQTDSNDKCAEEKSVDICNGTPSSSLTGGKATKRKRPDNANNEPKVHLDTEYEADTNNDTTQNSLVQDKEKDDKKKTCCVVKLSWCKLFLFFYFYFVLLF